MKPIKDLSKHLKGKIVQKVDTSACNCVWMFFADGSILLLEAESVGHGLVGPVPYEATAEEYAEATKPAPVTPRPRG